MSSNFKEVFEVGVPLFFLRCGRERGTLKILTCSPWRSEAGRLWAGLTGGGVVLMGSGAFLGELRGVALSGATAERDAAETAALVS